MSRQITPVYGDIKVRFVREDICTEQMNIYCVHCFPFFSKKKKKREKNDLNQDPASSK